MRDEDRLGAAVAAVYDSVLNQAGWSGALGAVAGAFEASAATLWRYDPVLGTMAEAHAFGHDPAALRAYAEHHVHDDPATPVVLAAGLARWLSDEVLLDPRQLSHRRYVHEFALPNGIGRVGGAVVLHDAGGLLYLGVQRQPGAPRFGAEGGAHFQRLAPHLARADQLRRRLQAATHGRRLERAVLDLLSLPVCVVDVDGRVLLANAAWGQLAAAAAPLGVRHGRLVAGPAVPGGWLPRALSRACGWPPAAATQRLHAAEGLGWILALIPLPRHNDLAEGAEPPRALLTLSRPGDTLTSTAVLRDLFGVTMTEAVLLKALAAGESVQAHAARRRVSVHTVRSHIAALLDKLGCRSQLELAALARALPPWRQQ